MCNISWDTIYIKCMDSKKSRYGHFQKCGGGGGNLSPSIRLLLSKSSNYRKKYLCRIFLSRLKKTPHWQPYFPAFKIWTKCSLSKHKSFFAISNRIDFCKQNGKVNIKNSVLKLSLSEVEVRLLLEEVSVGRSNGCNF